MVPFHLHQVTTYFSQSVSSVGINLVSFDPFGQDLRKYNADGSFETISLEVLVYPLDIRVIENVIWVGVLFSETDI
jgi:hypothetical protein